MKFVSCLMLVTVVGFLSVCGYADEQVPDVTVSTKSISNTEHYTLAPVHSISKEQIEISSADTVSDILESESSIQLQKLYSNGNHVSPSLRGFGDNANTNTLILIDGLPLTNPDLGPVMIDTIPLDDVKEINILSGSAGVLYGDQAVGGVINIITKKHRKSYYKAGVKLGSYAFQQYQTSISHRWNNGLTVYFGAERKQANGYRAHNKFSQNNAQFGVGYQYQSGSVFLQYHYVDDDLQYPGALTADQLASDRRQAQNDTDFNNENHHNILLQWKQVLSDRWNFQQDAMLQTMGGKGVLTNPFIEDRNLFVINPKVSGSFDLGKLDIKNQSGFLVQTSRYKINGAGFSDDSSQNKQAVFTQFVILVLPNVTTSLGGRLAQSHVDLETGSENNKALNSAGIFSLGIDWKLKEYLSLYARRVGNFRFPKAEENALTIDNQSLKTQKGVSYEGGLVLKKNKTRFSVNVFQLDLNNEILFVPNLSGLLGVNENLSPTRRFGGSVSIRYPFTHKWHFGFEYSYVNARFSSGVDNGKRIPFVAANKAKLSTDYYLTDRLNLYVSALITGDRFPGGDLANEGSIVPAYAVYNLSLRYKLRYITITAKVNNLTNVKYNYYAQVSPRGPGPQTFYYPAPGRNFWLGLLFDL